MNSGATNPRSGEPSGSGNLKQIEACSGVGAIESGGRVLGNVGYRIARFQGMSASGMPVPGLHRLEGIVELGAAEAAPLVGVNVVLRLADGRALGIALADADGRVLSEGHGPSKCQCC